MIDRNDDEIWLVYESSYFLCVVDSETKAEGICFAYEFRNWKRFVTPTEASLQKVQTTTSVQKVHESPAGASIMQKVHIATDSDKEGKHLTPSEE